MKAKHEGMFPVGQDQDQELGFKELPGWCHHSEVQGAVKQQLAEKTLENANNWSLKD